MSRKFEQLLDYLVNEESDKADELFHSIVVEKSREIYENLISEEEKEKEDEKEVKETSEEEDESVEEASDDEEDESVEESAESEEDETVESMFSEEGEEEPESEFPVQDKTDDFEDEVTDHNATDADEFGGDEMDAGDEDPSAPADKGDIQELESALDELKAEFEALMKGKKHEEEEMPGVHGEPSPLDQFNNNDGEDEEDEEDEEKSPFESSEDDEEEGVAEGKKNAKKPLDKKEKKKKSQGETMREYIEKVKADMDGGLVGARTGETVSAPKEGKSPISSGSGKPTSGANAKNIAQAGKGEDQDGTKPQGKVGGVVKKGGDLHSGGFENTQSKSRSIHNVWSTAKKVANKEGQGVGAQTGNDKAGQTGGNTNTRSIESGK
jgi:hypothetical protein